MNTKNLPSILLFFCLALSGCSPTQPGATWPGQVPVISSPAPSDGAAAASRTPRPTATPMQTATSLPTPTVTATSNPAVFDIGTFGDIRTLDSFVLHEITKETGQGYLYNSDTRSEYNRNQSGFHVTYKYDGYYPYGSGMPALDDDYWLGEWNYQKDNLTSLWSVTRPSKESFNEFPLDRYSLDRTYIDYFKSANYLGVEQYNGITAYHYTMDEMDLGELKNWKVQKAAGELFVSVEGRYLLHAWMRFSDTVIHGFSQDAPWVEGVVEETQDLVSFNQPMEISLPADYPNFSLDLDFPLPAGSDLKGMGQDAYGRIEYAYVTPVNEEEFKTFYASVDPASGWTPLGQSDVNYGDYWCTTCLIFSRDGQEVAVEFFNDTRFSQFFGYYIYVNFLPPR